MAKRRTACCIRRRDPRPIPRPSLDLTSEEVKLTAPARVLAVHALRPHDEEVDVAARVPLSPGRGAEHRNVNRCDLPRVDRTSKSPKQLAPHSGEDVDRGCREVLAIEREEERAPRLLPVDDAVLREYG